MAQSREKLVAGTVVIEGTYGSSGTAPAPNQASDSILLYENPNPATPDVERINITPLRPTLAPSKDIVGRLLSNMQVISYLQGAENLTTGLPWRCARLLRACGVLETVANNSSILYRPISSGFASVAMQMWPEGWLFTLLGGYGTFTIEADAGQGVKCTFDMQGVQPSVTTPKFQKNITLPTQTLETVKAIAFKNCPVTITGGAYTVGGALVAGGYAITGGTALTPAAVCKRFRLTANVKVEERKDSGAADGLAGLIITGYEPELQLDIELDTNPNINPFDDWVAGTLHAVDCNLINGGVGNIWNFRSFWSQLTSISTQIVNGLRVAQLTYQLTTPNIASTNSSDPLRAEDVWQLKLT